MASRLAAKLSKNVAIEFISNVEVTIQMSAVDCEILCGTY